MNQNTHIRLPNRDDLETIDGLVEEVVDAILENIEIARECGARIRKEGIVVRDLNGTVIEHPSIKTQASAMKLYTDLLKKHATV